MVKTVLVISLSDVAGDPRVDRQVEALSKRYRVVVAGYGPPSQEDVEFVALEHPARSRAGALGEAVRGQGLRVLRRFDRAVLGHSFWRESLERLWGRRIDLVLANDVATLPLAFRVADGAPVALDAHEHATSQAADIWWWRLFLLPEVRWICRTYIPRLAAMTTVSPGLARLYEQETGVLPEVMVSAPPFHELEPSPVGDTVRMVHFGIAHPRRRLEETIAAMSHLDGRYRLDLVFRDRNAHTEELRRLAAGDHRIGFPDPVPMRELPSFANAYDIGVFMLPPRFAQQRFTLPNKFFEYIQARLAVAIGPSPDMAELAAEWDLGIVAEDFTGDALGRAIAAAGPERLAELKANAGRAAHALCAERNEPRLLEIVAAALEGASAGQPAPHAG